MSSVIPPEVRPIAPGGWRRAVVGTLVGVCVGLVIAATSRAGGS